MKPGREDTRAAGLRISRLPARTTPRTPRRKYQNPRLTSLYRLTATSHLLAAEPTNSTSSPLARKPSWKMTPKPSRLPPYAKAPYSASSRRQQLTPTRTSASSPSYCTPRRSLSSRLAVLVRSLGSIWPSCQPLVNAKSPQILELARYPQKVLILG